MLLPHSFKLNIAERHLQVSHFQLGAEARREQHQAIPRCWLQTEEIKTELMVNNPSLQHPAPLTVGTSSNNVTEIIN